MINKYIYIYIKYVSFYFFSLSKPNYKKKIIIKKRSIFLFSFLISFLFSIYKHLCLKYLPFLFFSFPYHILPLNILFSLSVVVTNHNVKMKRKLKNVSFLALLFVISFGFGKISLFFIFHFYKFLS